MQRLTMFKGKNINNWLLIIVVFIFGFNVLLAPVHAQNNKNTSNKNTAANANKSINNSNNPTSRGSGSDEVDIPAITDSFNGKSLSQLALQLIRILFLLIIIAAVIVIVVAGFRMTTGGGNPEQIKKAKKAIVWAILGVIVALMSYSVVEIISRLFN